MSDRSWKVVRGWGIGNASCRRKPGSSVRVRPGAEREVQHRLHVLPARRDEAWRAADERGEFRALLPAPERIRGGTGRPAGSFAKRAVAGGAGIQRTVAGQGAVVRDGGVADSSAVRGVGGKDPEGDRGA